MPRMTKRPPKVNVLRDTFLAPEDSPASRALAFITPSTVRAIRALCRDEWMGTLREWSLDGFGDGIIGSAANFEAEVDDLRFHIDLPEVKAAVYTQPMFMPGVLAPWHGAKAAQYTPKKSKKPARFIVLHPNALASVDDLLRPIVFGGCRLTALGWLSGVIAHELSHLIFPGPGLPMDALDHLFSGKATKEQIATAVSSPTEVVAYSNQARFEVMYARLYTPPPHRPTMRQAMARSPSLTLMQRTAPPDVLPHILAHVRKW